MRLSATAAPRLTQVIGIASGKGGVGKTSIAANLAVALVVQGNAVMLFDADLGLANAQLALGCLAPFNFSHVLSGERRLEEIIVTSPQGVRLVPGASGLQHMASLNAAEAAGIIRAFSTLEERADYMIVDSAAGIADSVVTFMQAARHRFVVVCDDPSSIADAYCMIKLLADENRATDIYLVPSMVPSQSAGRELHRRINDLCQRFLGVSVRYLHSVTRDEHMLAAMQARKSVFEFAPGGKSTGEFRHLASLVESMTSVDAASGGIEFFLERLARSRNVA